MIYLMIFYALLPIFLILKPFRKPSKKPLLIQTAKIGDYANSTIIFELLGRFDIVLDDVNLAFANYDERIEGKFGINEIKKSNLTKLKFAFKVFWQNYSGVYVLTPNSLSLFFAKCAFAPRTLSISHYNTGSHFKLLSEGMQKFSHTLDDLTLNSYLKMFNSPLNGYKKTLQKPLFIPQICKIDESKSLKVGISLSAGNKMKTPPPETWEKIFKILANFNANVYIFGIDEEFELLKNINTSGTKIISLVDKIPLQELAFHIAKMDIYISSDTGNYYIADSMEVATICLMGPCFASEQRGVYNSLVISPKLEPISSVFDTVTQIDAKKYFLLTKDDEKKIADFISLTNRRLHR